MISVDETRQLVGKFPVMPAEYFEAVELVGSNGRVELRCVYQRDTIFYSSGLKFSNVRAYQVRAEGHCTEWHIDDAYIGVVEIDNSRWLGELREVGEAHGSVWKMRHFLIYLDDFGAYEVAAEDVEWLPEAAAS